MATQRILDDDLIRVRPRGTEKPAVPLPILFWGDTVNVVGEENGQSVVQFSRQRFDDEAHKTVTEPFEGLLPAKARFRDAPLLKVRFVDVGQGDGPSSTPRAGAASSSMVAKSGTSETISPVHTGISLQLARCTAMPSWSRTAMPITSPA
jgi:hypothetical protein